MDTRPVRTEAGWPAAATALGPGGELSWSFTFTRRGSRTNYRVCADLTPGEYRFGYWGAGERAIPAVRFDVLDSK